MLTLKKFKLGVVLSTISLLSLPIKGFAYNFNYTQDETVIFNTDFDSSSGWLLSGTVIDSGLIKGSSPWGKASYSITPVNLDKGNVFLYWSGIFPRNARTEPDKYYVGLQYADNAPVCYDNPTNQIVGTPPCTGLTVSEVDENAELKVEMRPRDKTNLANTYHKLYIDPDFDPINNYSPVSTRLAVPNYVEGVAMDFRLQISKGLTQSSALFSFWNGISWQSMTAKQGYSFPLLINSSDWSDANRQSENPVTFEAINLAFRQAASTRQSAITAIALTQVLSQTSLQQRQASVQVNEPSSITALSFLGLGIFFLRKKKNKESQKL